MKLFKETWEKFVTENRDPSIESDKNCSVNAIRFEQETAIQYSVVVNYCGERVEKVHSLADKIQSWLSDECVSGFIYSTQLKTFSFDDCVIFVYYIREED